MIQQDGECVVTQRHKPQLATMTSCDLSPQFFVFASNCLLSDRFAKAPEDEIAVKKNIHHDHVGFIWGLPWWFNICNQWMYCMTTTEWRVNGYRKDILWKPKFFHDENSEQINYFRNTLRLAQGHIDMNQTLVQWISNSWSFVFHICKRTCIFHFHHLYSVEQRKY